MSGVAEGSSKSMIREYVEAILVALIFVNFAWTFVVQMFKIPSGSMVDNLLVGDHIVVNKFAYGPAGAPALGAAFPFREIHRGDIVVFRYPPNPALDYVKRVVALPGETIEIRDKVVFIDGRALDEPYVIHVDPLVIPNKPLLRGGARGVSRVWGRVSGARFKGRAIMVYWSYSGPPPANATLRELLGEMAGVAIHFWSRTRWDRTFFIVDSSYHYHAERQRGLQGE